MDWFTRIITLVACGLNVWAMCLNLRCYFKYRDRAIKLDHILEELSASDKTES